MIKNYGKKAILISFFLVQPLLFAENNNNEASLKKLIREEIGTILREELNNALKEIIDSLKKEIKQMVAEAVKSELKNLIGYLDPYAIIEKSDEYKEEEKKVQKEVEARSQQIKSLQESFAKKKNELDTMGSTLNESARERKQEELVSLDTQIRMKAKTMQEYVERASQEAQMKISKKIQQAAEEVRKEKGMLIIMAGGVITADDSINVSDIVLKKMNTLYAISKKKTAEKKDEKKVTPPLKPN